MNDNILHDVGKSTRVAIFRALGTVPRHGKPHSRFQDIAKSLHDAPLNGIPHNTLVVLDYAALGRRAKRRNAVGRALGS